MCRVDRRCHTGQAARAARLPSCLSVASASCKRAATTSSPRSPLPQRSEPCTSQLLPQPGAGCHPSLASRTSVRGIMATLFRSPLHSLSTAEEHACVHAHVLARPSVPSFLRLRLRLLLPAQSILLIDFFTTSITYITLPFFFLSLHFLTCSHQKGSPQPLSQKKKTCLLTHPACSLARLAFSNKATIT